MQDRQIAQKAVLHALFERSNNGGITVDRLKFRVDHEAELDTLDRCEHDGYIRSEKDRYVLTLLGVAELDASARDFFDAAELLFCELRKLYRDAPGANVLLSDLALRTNMPVPDVAHTLALMTECNDWWAGRNSFDDVVNAFIVPSEGVLRVQSFSKCVQRIQEARRIAQELPVPVLSELFPLLNDNLGFSTNATRVVLSSDLLEVLPTNIASLLNEVHVGIHYKLLTIASMGLRAVIDMICVDKVGDLGPFKAKLTALRERGHISISQADTLAIVIEAGNASAHRGHMPDEPDIETVLAVVENLLHSLYVHPKSAEKLAKKTPARDSRPDVIGKLA